MLIFGSLTSISPPIHSNVCPFRGNRCLNSDTPGVWIPIMRTSTRIALTRQSPLNYRQLISWLDIWVWSLKFGIRSFPNIRTPINAIKVIKKFLILAPKLVPIRRSGLQCKCSTHNVTIDDEVIQLNQLLMHQILKSLFCQQLIVIAIAVLIVWQCLLPRSLLPIIGYKMTFVYSMDNFVMN